MADEINVISDKDLQAPLELAKNYRKLADDFDAVAASTTLLMSKIESQDATIAELTGHTKALEKEVKKLEETNKKAAKSTESMAAATELADDATGGLVTRVKTLGKQFLALLVNPVVALFAALVVVLGSVATYFKTTNEGADKFENILNALNGVIKFITDKFAELGKQIVKLFEEGNIVGEVFVALLSSVINRVAGVIDAFTNIIKILNVLGKYNISDILGGKLAAEDWIELGKAVEGLGKSAVQAITGIGDAADEAMAKVKSLNSLLEAGRDLEDAQRNRILSKAEAELEIEKLLFKAKDKSNNSDQSRLDALTQAVRISEKQLEIDLQLATRRERLFAADLLHKNNIINTEAEANKILAEGTTLLQDQTLESQAFGEDLLKRKELQAEVVNLQRNFFAEQKKSISQIGALQKEIDDAAIARAEKLVKLRLAAFDKYIQGTKEVSALEILGVEETEKTRVDLAKNFGDRLIADRKARLEKEKEIEKERLKMLQEQQEKERIIRESAIVAVGMIGDEIFARRQEKLEAESQAIEVRRAEELKAAGDDERAKLAINRKFDREQAKIKTKQAQADKQAAIFGIIINTALGIMKAAPVIPLMIATGVLGAIQLALVASKPIPKFATGTDHAPSTFIAGEKGRELISHKGMLTMADRATLFTGMEGARVFSNPATEEILGTSADIGHAIRYGSKPRQEVIRDNKFVEVLTDNNKWLKRIANKEEVDLVVDENGFHKYLGKARSRSEYINRRFGSW